MTKNRMETFLVAEVSRRTTVLVRPIEPHDFQPICRDVTDSAELGFIATEDTQVLTPDILERWLKDAEATFVFQVAGTPVGFATASSSEWLVPRGAVELCHLHVARPLRRQHHGSTYVRLVTNHLLHTMGFQRVVGRVVPTNSVSLSFLHYLRWEEITDAFDWTRSTPYRWFEAPKTGPLPPAR